MSTGAVQPVLCHAHLALHDEQQLVHDLALHPVLNLVDDVRPRLLVGYEQQHAWDLLSALLGLDADNVLRILFLFHVALINHLFELTNVHRSS